MSDVEHEVRRPGRRLLRAPSALMALVMLATVLTLAITPCPVAGDPPVANAGPDQTVDIDLIWTKRVNVPVISVVFWSFIIGTAVSFLLFVSIYLKQSNQINRSRKQIKGLESEVAALRNRPIDESKNLLDNGGLRE